MENGFFGNFAAYLTIHWCKNFVSTLSCLLCHFGAHFLERSAERALNLGITGAFWDIWIASMVHVMREWFPFLKSFSNFHDRPDRPDRT